MDPTQLVIPKDYDGCMEEFSIHNKIYSNPSTDPLVKIQSGMHCLSLWDKIHGMDHSEFPQGVLDNLERINITASRIAVAFYRLLKGYEDELDICGMFQLIMFKGVFTAIKETANTKKHVSSLFKTLKDEWDADVPKLIDDILAHIPY